MRNILGSSQTPEVLGRCPVCSSELTVQRLRCSSCSVALEGEFHLNPFNRLSSDQQRFVEIFLVSRGNMSEVQKELGVSYPTVRARLEEVISQLGHKPASNEVALQAERVSTLQEVESGALSVEEALRRLANRE